MTTAEQLMPSNAASEPKTRAPLKERIMRAGSWTALAYGHGLLSGRHKVPTLAAWPFPWAAGSALMAALGML